MNDSILTRNQKKTFGPVIIAGWGGRAMITATVRFDDDCGNGHNTFSITGEIRRPGRRDCESCGCLHDEIAAHFPTLAPLIKFHLCSTDGPMHYVANTLYHADGHDPWQGWLTVEGQIGNVAGVLARGMIYGPLGELEALAQQDPDRCTIKVDAQTAKIRNLDHARASACWPDATDEDLTAPGLQERLEARLPALMAEFRAAIESLGFTW